MPIMAQISFLMGLIIINAFFAAAEMAIVSSNKNKLKVFAQEGNKKANLLLNLLEEPNKFLSTIQVAITFAGFLASAVAAIGMSGGLAQLITSYGIPYGEMIAVFIVTLIISFISLSLGELYPKRLALQHSEKVAMALVRPVLVFAVLTRPFVWILSKTVDFFLMITGQRAEVSADEFSEDEVMSMLEVGKETGVLKEEGQKMINSIFAFDDKLAYEIMTPRTDVFTIDINDPTEEYIDELMELRHTRIPVYEEDNDNIIGILNIKDFLIKAREKGFDHVDIRAILRKPYFVPETKKIDSLFVDLKNSKQHIAILIDEYGGFSGIVTMEDIIEQVMGDIDDEYDEEEIDIEQIDDHTYMVGGFTDLDHLNEAVGLNLNSDNIETIGGFLIDILGEIPDDDDPQEHIIEYENCIFKIESVKERRIEKIRLTIVPEEDASEEEQS